MRHIYSIFFIALQDITCRTLGQYLSTVTVQYDVAYGRIPKQSALSGWVYVGTVSSQIQDWIQYDWVFTSEEPDSGTHNLSKVRQGLAQLRYGTCTICVQRGFIKSRPRLRCLLRYCCVFDNFPSLFIPLVSVFLQLRCVLSLSCSPTRPTMR